MKHMTPFRYAVALFFAPWLFGMAFDAVVYLHFPNPLEWNEFARGMTLIVSVFMLIMVWPWTFVLQEHFLDDDI